MNIYKYINDFNLNDVYYLDPIKNTVIDNSTFIRILYSNDLFILNGIYLYLNFNNITLNTINNKSKYYFDINYNNDLIESLKKIELDILNNYNSSKILSTKLYNQLTNGFIKNINLTDEITNHNETIKYQFVLKISGIWESHIHYGLTYKILDFNHPL